jgi:hypothetical protein
VMYPLVWLTVLGRPTFLPVASIGTRVPRLPKSKTPVMPALPPQHDHEHGHGPGQHSHEPAGHSLIEPAPTVVPANREVTLRGDL